MFLPLWVGTGRSWCSATRLGSMTPDRDQAVTRFCFSAAYLVALRQAGRGQELPALAGEMNDNYQLLQRFAAAAIPRVACGLFDCMSFLCGSLLVKKLRRQISASRRPNYCSKLFIQYKVLKL